MLLLSLLFTGYLVNIAAVTPVLQWVHYLSVFFFGFESLIVNEMSGISLIFSVSFFLSVLEGVAALLGVTPTVPYSAEVGVA